MYSFEEFKELLGPLGEKLTDEEIKHIMDMEYQIADAVFEKWLRKRNASVYNDIVPENEKRYNEHEHNINHSAFLVSDNSGTERG